MCVIFQLRLMKNYLSELDEFKNLPYYELAWSEDSISNVTIYEKNVRSIIQPCLDIIKNYKNNDFPKKEYNGQIIESKEVVFYVNSVKDICSIIKKSGLKDDEVNVICAHDSKNLKKLKAVGIKNYGTVPLEDDPHKMFTFCTRTAYLGADFYSTCAYTVVCSDCNIESMSLDISLDLPQIMGRQRKKENIFKDEAIIFYKIAGKTVSKEERDAYENQKLLETEAVIKTFASIDISDNIQVRKYLDNLNDLIKINKYTKDYISVSNVNGILCPVLNKLVLLSERRAWEIRNNNYLNKVSIIREIESENYEVTEYNQEKIMIDQFISEFDIDKNFGRRIKLLCDFLDKYPNYVNLIEIDPRVPRDYTFYYKIIGTDKIRSVGYKESDIRNFIDHIIKRDKISGEIIFTFLIGNKYTNKYIKEKLQEIYNHNSIKKMAKASDIEEYFEVKRARFQNKETGKRDEGLEIISLK